jgi:hypothetical protein
VASNVTAIVGAASAATRAMSSRSSPARNIMSEMSAPRRANLTRSA